MSTTYYGQPHIVHSQTNVGVSSGLSLALLHFPDLRALSLHNFIFDLYLGIEDFILRNAKPSSGSSSFHVH